MIKAWLTETLELNYPHDPAVIGHFYSLVRSAVEPFMQFPFNK